MNPTIVALGDSLTYGYPYSPPFSWANLMAERLGIPCVNKGLCGDTTAGMLRRFTRHVLSFAPAYVIIMGGTNDLFRSVRVEAIVDNVGLLVELARQKGIVPVVGIPAPCNDSRAGELPKLCRQLRTYCTSQEVACIDFYAVLADDGGTGFRADLDSDGLHPNKQGHQLMAAAACTVMSRILSDARERSEK